MRLQTIVRLTLFCLVLAPVSALSAPAITCHCFTDRAYDPARPTVADPYFLANAQNSFFAAAFGVEKRAIVVLKQRGVPSEDLWIAYGLALRSGRNAEALLQERKEKGSWRQVAAALPVPAKTQGGRFAEALKRNAADAEAAAALVDDLLLRFRFYPEPELAALRKAGATSQEAILAGMLSAKTRQQAKQLHLEVKKGKTSWGALLTRAGIEGSGIQPQMAQLVSSGTSR